MPRSRERLRRNEMETIRPGFKTAREKIRCPHRATAVNRNLAPRLCLSNQDHDLRFGLKLIPVLFHTLLPPTLVRVAWICIATEITRYPKAEERATKNRLVAVARGGTDNEGCTVPAAATLHMLTAIAGHPRTAIRRCGFVVGIPTVFGPLPNISQHVVKPERVCWKRSRWRRVDKTIGAIRVPGQIGWQARFGFGVGFISRIRISADRHGIVTPPCSQCRFCNRSHR